MPGWASGRTWSMYCGAAKMTYPVGLVLVLQHHPSPYCPYPCTCPLTCVCLPMTAVEWGLCTIGGQPIQQYMGTTEMALEEKHRMSLKWCALVGCQAVHEEMPTRQGYSTEAQCEPKEVRTCRRPASP